MSTWPGWGADEDLLPGSFETERYRDAFGNECATGVARWVPAATMPCRRDAIRAILSVVELEDEAAVEVALMALGVNPVELFFAGVS